MEIKEYLDNFTKFLEKNDVEYEIQTEKKETREGKYVDLRNWDLNWHKVIIKIIDWINYDFFILKNKTFFNIDFDSFRLELNEFIFDFVEENIFIKGILKLNGNVIQFLKIKVKNLNFLNIKELAE